jgi:hypothetical protein
MEHRAGQNRHDGASSRLPPVEVEHGADWEQVRRDAQATRNAQALGGDTRGRSWVAGLTGVRPLELGSFGLMSARTLGRADTVRADVA